MSNSDKILDKIKLIVKEKAPFAKVYLYGSRVRGTAKEDSDWDVLILLQRDIVTREIEEDLFDPLYDLELDSGEIISPMIYSEQEWNNKYQVTPFYQNVMRERRLL